MAIDLKNEPTTSLQLYDQLLTVTANDLTKFREYLEYGLKESKISRSFYDQKINVCDNAIGEINDQLEKIEKEIRVRFQKKFPKIISYKQLEALGASLTKEADEFEKLKLNKKEPKSDKPVIDFNTSKEKKI